jgi:hypothetical protein
MIPEIPEAQYEGERYLFSCPRCSEMNEREWDVRGSVEHCDMCGLKVYVGG